MAPIFPQFKKIELEDFTEIKNLTKNYPAYNDFEFMSLWTYNLDGNNQYSTLNGNFIIKVHDFITGDYFLSFLGSNLIAETIRTLIDYSTYSGYKGVLRLVPESNFTDFQQLQSKFSVIEDPDSTDYILSIDLISNLEGSSFHDKRNLVNRFKRDNPDYKVRIDSGNKSISLDSVIALFNLWQEKKSLTDEDTFIEKNALKKVYDLNSLLSISILGIYVENNLIGFGVCHPVSDQMVILSFEKADIAYKGIYEIITHEIAKHFQSLGYKYINYEQDLGLPGLRKSKNLWRPIAFLKKYTISLATNKI